MTIEYTKENFIPYVQNYLLQSKDAINYLAKRKVISSQVKDFGIGFSGKGVSFNNCNVYANRLIFPMRDEYGDFIGVVSRGLEASNFRYMKTLFDDTKKGFLFGIYNAIESIYKTKSVLLVEGVFDLLAVQPFFPASVAMLTSGLSSAHKEVLDRYVKKIIYVPDNDSAGQESYANLIKFCSKRYEIIKVDYAHKDLSAWLESDKASFSAYFTDLKNIFF